MIEPLKWSLPSDSTLTPLAAMTSCRRLPTSLLAGVTALTLSVASLSVSANPDITGNTISWPDDGWYEVQSSIDFSSICQGVSSCEVSPGLYTVINHTTGQRWENLSVGSTGPVVLDIWIKLPTDGWYQVQNSETYESVCEGVKVCDVVPGTYHVINHTTGQRWENIVVETERTAGEPTVSGNRISWTDEGWYQVLRADDYSAVCEGGSSCEVPNGSYVVINHWTGQRWEPIEVNGGSTPMPTDTDSDGIPDASDNCINTPNADQADANSDGVGDACEVDDSIDIRASVDAGSSETLSISVDVPSPETGGLGGDFMVLFDRSGSFSDDLSTFRSEVSNIEMALQDKFADIRIGLASFVDAPCYGFGRASDFGYELNLPLNDTGSLSDTLDGLDIRSGSDGPESQLEAMRQAMTGSGYTVDPSVSAQCAGVADIAPTFPGYDKDRVRFLLVSTDASFHRPSDTNYPYSTSVDDVITDAQKTGTTILFLNSGSTDVAAETIANATGGGVYNLGSASEEIVATLRAAVSDAITSVDVEMVAKGDGSEFVASIDPEQITLNLLENRTVSFDITLSPDIGTSTEDRVFQFDLITSASGAEISRLVVELTVPGV